MINYFSNIKNMIHDTYYKHPLLFLSVMVIIAIIAAILIINLFPSDAKANMFGECCFRLGSRPCCLMYLIEQWWDNGGNWPGY
jgi:hypothetical protein